MDNLELYKKYSNPPKEALKKIEAGRLKGKSDINPMFRIKCLTEEFGPIGKGWYYEIIDTSFQNGVSNQVSCFVKIALYVKYCEEWSYPIIGLGGSMFISQEKNGYYQDDDCQKKALTDAIGVACKAIGIASDVYWSGQWSDSKNDPDQPNPNVKPLNNEKPDSRKELTPEMKEVQACISALMNGYTIHDIEKKYRLSDDMKQFLMDASI